MAFRASLRRLRFLHLAVFVSGMATVAVEITAGRFVAPYFGTSVFVWTNIIGIVLIALTLGYHYGGRLADRDPRPERLYGVILLAGLLTGLVPLLAQPILDASVTAFLTFSADVFFLSFVATLLLLAVPLLLLGFVSPFAIRLDARSVTKAGKTSGRIFAVSTLGSILGVYIPALLTIPLLGSRATIFLFAGCLIGIALWGLRRRLLRPGEWKIRLLALGLVVVMVGAALPGQRYPRNTVFQAESAYNYVRVYREGDALYLQLNEPFSVHSKYVGDGPYPRLTGDYWDHFLLPPSFAGRVDRVLIIGLAAGTMAGFYVRFFPNATIDGVEIDGKVLEVGRTYFHMTWPQLRAIEMDGRLFVKTTREQYDVVIVDAYHAGYIPFHLISREFFAEVRGLLAPGGVVALNIATVPGGSGRLIVEAIGNTMAGLYGGLYALPTQRNDTTGALPNWMLLGTESPVDIPTVKADLAARSDAAGALGLDAEELARYRRMLSLPYTSGGIEMYEPTGPVVFTDDVSPVEILLVRMVLG